ncbi:uncharacterized protein LOC143039490 [Oratosquilla oratoria]|uniref:uncharacterized protein LOC143039490 n=1 Tax=Oratosquilla oratoria TaxID=337810 RepID=UPI003F76F860
MNSWSFQEMRTISKIAHLYVLDNMTKDYGFFLYAAPQSNVGTVFVTRSLKNSASVPKKVQT